jgi:hypothetical protein
MRLLIRASSRVVCCLGQSRYLPPSMAQSHLRKVFAVNIAQAVSAKDTSQEAELRQLVRLLPQKELLLRYALRALRSPDHRRVLHLVFAAFEGKKDARVVRPVVAWLRQETDPYLVCCALWCLANYDCSAYLLLLAQQMARLPQGGEAAHVLVLVIKAMKGPFAAPSVRKAIHVLSRAPVEESAEGSLVGQLLRAQAVETCALFYRMTAAAELAVHDDKAAELNVGV